MATRMDLDTDVEKFLDDQRQNVPPDLQHYYGTFKELYERKLWHQLTVAVEEFVKNPKSSAFQSTLFERFVSDWEDKMNKLKLVEIGLSAAKQFQDASMALIFLQTHVTPKVNTPASQEAYVLATTESAQFQLLLGQSEETKRSLDESERILQSFDSVDTIIWASFYRVGTEYYKAKAEYANYYRTALLYLACINLDELNQQDRVERAYDLSIAALLGDTIYNFGELLMHPVLNSLEGTPHEWLRSLLNAFNKGDIGKYNSLAANFTQQPLLQRSLPALTRKICLMTLIESVFRRPTSSRTIPFADIAADTKLPINEVEHLVMKALSLGLIRGKIDQVEGVVDVRWVQPRVLDKDQIKGMKDRLDAWVSKVKSVGNFVETEGGEVFAQ